MDDAMRKAIKEDIARIKAGAGSLKEKVSAHMRGMEPEEYRREAIKELVELLHGKVEPPCPYELRERKEARRGSSQSKS